eukprot:3434645-Pleurochrysis_carterae.AAC.2
MEGVEDALGSGEGSCGSAVDLMSAGSGTAICTRRHPARAVLPISIVGGELAVLKLTHSRPSEKLAFLKASGE